jgi:hypothetical protein
MRALHLIMAAMVVGALTCSARAARAQSQEDSEARALSQQIKKLQKGLKERDALIHELLLRVRKLESVEGEKKARARRAEAAPALRPNRKPTATQAAATVAERPAQQAQSGASAETAPPAQASNAEAAAPEQPANAAPGQFTVSKEAAEHALERALVETGALLLPPGKVEFVPGLTYQFQQVSRPTALALTSNGNVLITEDVLRASALEATPLFRVGLPWQSQVQLTLPVEYETSSVATRVEGAGLSETTHDAGGLADPTLTLTKQIAEEGEWLPSLFASGEYSANVGELRNGIQLGNGFNEFRVGLLASKRQDPLVFTAGFTYQTALENRGISLGDQYIPALGMLFAVSPETSLQFSQQVTFQNSSLFNGRTIPGSQLVEGVFNAGVLSILAPGIVVNFNVGIGETPDAPDLTFLLQFPIRLN